MEDIVLKCNALIEELSKFSRDILYLGNTITDNRLELFEKQTGFEFPFDFEYLIKKINGLSLDGTEIYGLDKALRGSSLDEVYKFEHWEAGNSMPSEFLPFSPDGYGNHYCLNLSKMDNGLCPVVFWQHDVIYRSKDEVEECNDSFVSWIWEVVIEWTLEDYNYDGTEK